MSPGAQRVVVDVLVTAYNAERTIREALQSIRQQTLRDIRIVVVDDGSQDGTAAILEALAREDERLVVLTKTNGGIVDAIAFGLPSCEAEYLARFDADDVSYPARLERQLAYLRAHPACVAVSAMADHIDANGASLGTKTAFPSTSEAQADRVPAREPYLLQPMLMMRRRALDAIGGYRRLEVAEDSDLYWRLAELGTLTNLDDVLGAYRWDPDSISSKSIVHGRRLAYWSQLAALSAQRRQRGGPDLAFDYRRDDARASTVTLDELFVVGCDGLTDAEKRWLRIATSIKLMELVWRRPYEIDASDCRFIAQALRDGGDALEAGNRVDVDRQRTATAMRLLGARRVRDALRLAGTSFPSVAARAAARALVPTTLYARMRGRGS